MEFKHSLEVLQAQAEEINHIVTNLRAGKELHQIEIDLLLEKLRDIYDLVRDLQSTLEPAKKAEIKKTPVTPPEVQDESDKTENVEPVFEIEQETEEKNPQAVEKKPKEQPSSDRISDRFGSSKRILNEEMSEKTKANDISTQYKSSPITSITSAIGVNERFELINELFEGDRDRFDKTMEVLNMADSFVEAYNYLEENFSWDMDNAYVQRILELIRRKLIVRRNEQ